MRWVLVVADALVIAAIVAGAVDCGAPAETARPNPMTCMVWITPPGFLPLLWTCTSGASSLSAGRPDHVACVECADEPLWAPTDGGTCVPSCRECTPSQLLRLDPTARCTPMGEPESPAWYPRDMAP